MMSSRWQLILAIVVTLLLIGLPLVDSFVVRRPF
jgi:hypothetical protein